jgi:hypothetical protein
VDAPPEQRPHDAPLEGEGEDEEDRRQEQDRQAGMELQVLGEEDEQRAAPDEVDPVGDVEEFASC